VVRLIIILTPLVLLSIGGVAMWQHYVVDKIVTLRAAAGTSITLGKPFGPGNNAGVLGDTILQTNSQAKIRLSPGSYILVFSGADYAAQTQKITVSSNNLTLSTPSLNYSAQKLDSLLADEKPAIQTVVSGINSLSGYTTSYESLYGAGDWYAAKLAPPDPTTQDVLRVVLHKENGVWQVAATPTLILYSGDYKSIPVAVVRDIDNS